MHEAFTPSVALLMAAVPGSLLVVLLLSGTLVPASDVFLDFDSVFGFQGTNLPLRGSLKNLTLFGSSFWIFFAEMLRISLRASLRSVLLMEILC